MGTFTRILAWIAVIAVGLIAAAVIAMIVFGSIAASRFNRRLDQVRATGAPMSLAELAHDPVAPEKDAAVFLRRAADELTAVDRELNDVYESDAYHAGLPNESELESIREALEAHPQVVSLLEQAARCPDYVSQLDYSVDGQAFLADSVSRLQEVPIRSAARFLKAHALLSQSRGNPEEALESGIVILQLSRHFGREPTLVAYQISQACRSIGVGVINGVLRAGPVPDGSRRRLDAELACHEGAEAFQWAIMSERALGMDTWQAIPARKLWPARVMWDDDQTAYLDMMDQHLALASQPYSALVDTGLASQAPRGQRAVLTQLAGPVILRTREAKDRALAEIRCLRVLNALQTLDPADGVEPRLTDLGLPVEATSDPFTGEPLKLRKGPAGWVIYAVGADLVDGGGDFEHGRDVGVGPLQTPDGTAMGEL